MSSHLGQVNTKLQNRQNHRLLREKGQGQRLTRQAYTDVVGMDPLMTLQLLGRQASSRTSGRTCNPPRSRGRGRAATTEPRLAHEDSEESFKGPSVVDKLNMPLDEKNPRSNKNRKNPLLMNRGTGRRNLVHRKTPRTANFKSSFSTKPEGSSNCRCHRTSRVLLQPEMWRWICSSTSHRKWRRSLTHK